jgi:two-component system, OmpR family, sensor histidine kinase KdpD
VLRRRPVRVLVALSGVVLVTYVGYRLIPVNATTVGFAYLLLILIVASTWGFLEAALASVLATLMFNFFFLPPIGTFTIADPQNWIALFSFLATSLIASRLSTTAKTRALEAIERRRDLERLYAFSRAMLLIDKGAPFAKQLIEKLVEIFSLEAAMLPERLTGEFYCIGVAAPEGFEDDLRLAALSDGPPTKGCAPYVIVGVRSGSEPVASMALHGATMPDSVLQGVANLVAIGLERARAQDLPSLPTAVTSSTINCACLGSLRPHWRASLSAIYVRQIAARTLKPPKKTPGRLCRLHHELPGLSADWT